MATVHILVVDDEKEVAKLVVARLQKHGFSANAVNSGKSALEYVKSKRPDLIILDLFMPEMDGYEVARRLRSNKTTENIAIIMLTVEVSQKDKIKALKMKIDDYLTKPFDADELIARVENVVRRTRGETPRKKSKNILITGGAGFIGSHLAEALLKKGHNIHIIDDFSTGRIENLAHIKDDKRLHLIRGSITDEVILSKAIEKCDTIFHLAATVGVKNVVDSPLDTIIYDTFGTELVLKYASSKKARVLVTSTSEVYGKTKVLPFKENADIALGPPDINRWSYACAKLLDEFLAMAYHRERNLEVTVVRLFNIIGARQVGKYGMVVPRFFKSALTNKPLRVFGDGNQARCFTYVDDAVDILVKLIDSKKAIGQIINLGSTSEITIKELAQKIKKITQSSSKIIFEPYQNYYGKHFQDVRKRFPDLAKLRRILGEAPKTRLDGMLEKLNNYYKSHPEELKRI